MCDSQVNQDPATGPDEGKEAHSSSPVQDLPPAHFSPPPLVPKVEQPSPVPQPDPVSLAHLRLLSAYRLSTQKHPSSSPSPECKWPVPANSDVEEYKVRWEDHANNILQQVARMEQDPASADVTVATKGFTMSAHRIVLAAASKFFSSVLQRVPPGQHPVIVVRDANPRHLKFVINFCYTGKVTIPAQDVNQVAKLAEDLEVYALSGSCQMAVTNATLGPATLPLPITNLRQKLYSQCQKFTFPHTQNLPLQNQPSSHQIQEDRSGKRHHSSSSAFQQEAHSRKRFKGTPIPVGKEVENSPSVPILSMSPTPPGSAPPNLPSSSFFWRNHPSPPNSAPPQPHSSINSSSHVAVKTEDSPLDLASPSQTLEPEGPLSLTPAHRSNPSSPVDKKEPFSPIPLQVPSTPNSLALALTEPLTPSTPTTPTAFSIINGDSTNSNRMGLGCNASGCSTGSRVLLWRFLLDLLHNPHYSPMYIRWIDRPAGIFRIMESDMVAQLWGMARKNSNMNYEKMSRGMRTYYKRGILFHIDGTKLIYKFNTSDPEIQQRMRYYDLALKDSESTEIKDEQQPSSSQASSPTMHSPLSVPNLPALQSLPNLPVAVTSSASSTIDSLYSPLLREFPQLSSSLLYEPYFSSFLSRATQRELY